MPPSFEIGDRTHGASLRIPPSTCPRATPPNPLARTCMEMRFSMRTLDRHNLSGGRVPEVTTVLITDMEGSTAYTQAQGDEVAMRLLRTHEKIVRGVVGRHGGREIKSMGDGFMIAFGAATE